MIDLGRFTNLNKEKDRISLDCYCLCPGNMQFLRNIGSFYLNFILHIILIVSISPGGLMFTLSSVIGSLVYLHVNVAWLWVYKLKIVDICFSHQSNPQRAKYCLWTNGRLSTSIQRSLPLICFFFLCHLTREKRDTLSVAFLTRHWQTQGIQSLSTKTEIFRLEID